MPSGKWTVRGAEKFTPSGPVGYVARANQTCDRVNTDEPHAIAPVLMSPVTVVVVFLVWIAASVPIALLTGRALSGRRPTFSLAGGVLLAVVLAVALGFASTGLALPTP